MKLKIAIIGTNGLPGKYGGWDQLLNHLTINLNHKYEFIVYTSSYNAEKGLTEYNGAKLKIIRLKANGYQSVLYDSVSLIHASIKKYDLLLVLGTSGCILFPLIKLFKGKLVLNPDGCEWKRGKWSSPAKAFLRLSEKYGIVHSDKIVSDNIVIRDYIKQTYNKESELIEYGGDNASYTVMSPLTSARYSIEPDKYAFKVCRIEPENNIEMILEAFKMVDLKFVLVGNWNNSTFGKNLRSKYKDFSNLILLDPIYDQKCIDELRSNCKIYIHGHSVGGTNPSLVEAMNLGLCCIVYNVEYNVQTTENSAIYFNSSKDLIGVLNRISKSEYDIHSYKLKMKEIATRRYLWEIITAKYSEVFQNVLGKPIQ